MASRKENIKSLFSNTRTRVIIVFTVVLLFVTILVGYIKFTKSTGSDLSSQVRSTPGNIESIPGAADPTAQYAQLQEQQNVDQAQQAITTGASAIPTIIRTQAIGQGVGVIGSQSGVGFTTLAQENDAGSQKSLWIQSLQNGHCSKAAIDKVISQGAQFSDLRGACSCIQLKDTGYGLKDLQSICACKELKAAGYTARQLKDIGFSTSRLRACGFNACELKNAGYSAQEMKNGGFSNGELKGAGYSDQDIAKTTNQPQLPTDLPEGITPEMLHEAGCDPSALAKLRTAGVNASAVRKMSGCNLEQLKKAGYTPEQLRKAGYSARDLLNAGFTKEQLLNGGYTNAELNAAEQKLPDPKADCSASYLKQAKAAGLSVSVIKEKLGCSVLSLKDAGFSAEDLKNAGFTAAELKNAGFTAQSLKDAGFSPRDMKLAGFTVSDLKDAGISPQELKKAGFTADELKKAGFNAEQLINAGFSPKDLNDAGFSASELKKLGTTPQALKDAGYSAMDLKDAGYSAKDLKDAGYSAMDLKDAGYSPKDLKDAGYSAKELKDAGYSVKDLKDAGYSPKDLKEAGFSAQELKEAGFKPAQLKEAGFSARELKKAGFTPMELKEAGFTPQELRQAGFTAAQLKAAGFSTQELKAAGYTANELALAGFAPEDSLVVGLGAPNFSPEKSTVTAIPSILGGRPAVSAQAISSSEQLQAVLNKQNEQIADQKYQQKIAQKTADMLNMANQSVTAWKTVTTQVYIEGTEVQQPANGPGDAAVVGAGGAAAGSSINDQNAQEKVAPIKTGDILFAVLDTAINSDEPGPILATIVSGKFKGTKLIGSFNLPANANSMVITFNTMSIPGAAKTNSISAFAIDPNTARTALSSRTDHHYLMRYGSLFASSFLEGFGNAFQSANTTVTVGGTGGANDITVQNGIGRSSLENAVIGLATVGKSWGQASQQLFSTPVTVEVYAGTGIGVLFTQDVTTI